MPKLNEKIIIFELDDDDATRIPYPVPGTNWQGALDQLSGEGAETQLVNALDALGLDVYSKMTEPENAD